jgi:MYXO-CTERM domain-containing protein
MVIAGPRFLAYHDLHMRPAALLAPLALALLSPVIGRADLMVEGFTRVPLELTLDHVDAFAGKEVVLLGCSQGSGRTSFGFARKDEATICSTKFGVEVLLVTARTAKDLRDLAAKDLGWGEESTQSRRILDAARPTSCGTVSETTTVDKKSGVRALAARYSLDTKPGGACGLTKISVTSLLAPVASADSSADPAPSASAAPAAPSAAPSTDLPAPPPPAAKSGCAGCAASPSAPSWPLAALFVLVGLVALRRPRRRP